jgi:hypothetical protein
MLIFIALVVATLFGTFGQFADAYTTYIGVDVDKVAVEGNSASTWLVAHPALSFLFKTGGPLLGGALALFAIPHVAPDQLTIDLVRIILIALEVTLGAVGFAAGLANEKINEAGKKQ